MKDDYLFGAVYIIEQEDSDEEIRRDLENMRRQGFNLVTLWPVANPWLDETCTGYVFTQTQKVLDLCGQLGLQAILQLFGQNQAYEFMSDALLTHDMLVCDEEGGTVNQNCFWANLNHPVVRERIEDYFRQAIGALKNHPAVYGWDVFNEAHFRSDDPYTIARYQRWLREKYGDIAALNRAWYRRYASFSQITPEKRGSSYSVWSSLLPEVDYERFRSENLTGICRFLVETARQYDGGHPILLDGTSSQLLQASVTARNNDEFDTARLPDIYGATFYPKSWGRDYQKTPWILSLYFSVPAAAARAAGKPYFVNELQTHTQSVLTPGSEVSPEELGHWLWMCVFTGASGIQLWRWRPFRHGYQATGRGLTRIDGTPNARSAKAAEVLRLLHKNAALFQGAAPERPVVGIGVSYRARLFFDALCKWRPNCWPDVVAGWYRLFWSMGLAVELVDLDCPGERERALPALVLPSMISVSSSTASWLEQYVDGGGLLFADARLGALNEWGIVPTDGVPGKTLSALFGFRELDVGPEGSFVVDEALVKAPFQTQTLQAAQAAEVLARTEDGDPAVIRNRHGKGQTVYFHSFVGLGLHTGEVEPAGGLVRELLFSRFPGLCHAEKDSHVHLSFLSAGGRRLMLAANFAKTETEVRLYNTGKDVSLVSLMTGERFPASSECLLRLAPDSDDVFVWDTTGEGEAK